VIIQEVISDRVAELDPTTVDSRTDQAAVGVSQMDTPLPSGSDNGSLSLGQPSLQPNVSGISEGLRHMEESFGFILTSSVDAILCQDGPQTIFPAGANHADQLGVILIIYFTLNSHFLCALESLVVYI